MALSLKSLSLSAATLLLAGVLPHAAHAQRIHDAVQAALENHPQIESASARISAAEEEEASQFSGYFPEIALSASGGRIFGDNATTRGLNVTRGTAYSYSWDGSASISQPIFDGFETLSRVRAARSEKESADLTLRDVHEQVAFQTAQAYLDVAQARIGLAMLRDQKLKVQDYLKRIESSVAQGGADDVELQQANDVIAILDGFITDYDSQRKIAISQYQELTGHEPGPDLEYPKVNSGLIPPNEDEALSYALRTHPLLQSAALLSEAAKHKIGAEKGLLYPDISGEVSYLKSEKREEIGGEVEDAKALLRMNWSFETGGGQMARVRKKKHEFEDATAQERQLQRQIERDVQIAFAQRDTAIARYENNKKRYALNKQLLETYNAQFEGGRVSLLQLMQADNQLFNTKLQTVISQYQTLAAEYGILASIGRLKDSLFEMASVEMKVANNPSSKEIKADDKPE